MVYIQYGIILVILFIVALAIIKGGRRDFKIEVNKLIEHLGGKENILNMEVNLSRLKVTLKDVSSVNKDAIQKLGARGIVEIDNQLKIVLGSEAKKLKKYIEDLKKQDVIK